MTTNEVWYPKNKLSFKFRAFIYRLTGWPTCQKEIVEWIMVHGPFESLLAFNLQLYIWFSEVGLYRYELHVLFGLNRHWLLWPIYFPVELVINIFRDIKWISQKLLKK